MVPTGYERHARILHPASDREGNPVRWSEVARFTGRTVHSLVQWHRLVGTEDSFGDGGLWPGGKPLRGELEPGYLAALIDVLAPQTASDRCWFAWDVHGHVDGPPGSFTRVYSYLGEGDTPPPAPSPRPPAPTPESLPRVQIATERYLLARGPLSSALSLGDWGGTEENFIPEAPGIWWPDDRAWCVGSNMDIDSTVVAGSAQLIADVLADPRLEALPVGPHDSLMYDADTLN